MRTHLLLFFLLLGLHTNEMQSQDIVSVEFNSTLTAPIARLLALTLGVTVDITYDVDFYVVEYTTTGTDMRLDTASGLFMIPDGLNEPLPILCYQHGTTDGRSDVPSNFGAAYQLGALFGSNGVAVAAPDYLGMGSSRGFHPYVHAETEATAAVDMIYALRTWLDEQGTGYTDDLFVTGYSQGGHAAMALHQYIETEKPADLNVTANLSMSGPYSLSGVMQGLSFDEEIDYLFPSFLVYSARALREVNPETYQSEDQLYKPSFLGPIEEFVRTGEGLGALNQFLVGQLVQENGMSTPRFMFKDSVQEVLLANPDHPFNVTLRESDVYDWTPQAPVLMLYCPSDDQVPFTNSIIADSVMNANGAPDVSAEDVSGGEILDHAQCAIPALNRGVPWLFSFLETTSTVEINLAAGLQMSPNPVSDQLLISTEVSMDRISIYSPTGQRLIDQSDLGYSFKIDASSMPNGVYYAHILTTEGLSVEKFLVSR
ncbi:MAG: alpha/beta fold hydrolase [Bacteroidota bacterium]